MPLVAPRVRLLVKRLAQHQVLPKRQLKAPLVMPLVAPLVRLQALLRVTPQARLLVPRQVPPPVQPRLPLKAPLVMLPVVLQATLPPPHLVAHSNQSFR